MTHAGMDEPILENDYPVYCGFFYVADGKVIVSDIEGDVGQLKRALKATEIRRCDMAERGYFLKPRSKP